MSISRREANKLVRTAVKRVPEGEAVSEINIMPMMDIMTILLVVVIEIAANSAAAKVTSNAVPPVSQTQEPLPKEAVSLTISKTAVLVDEALIVKLTPSGSLVPANELQDKDPASRYIPKLGKVLGRVRKNRITKLSKENKPIPKVHELWIFADRGTPYQTLMKVMYSARHQDAGYGRFRLIVVENRGK